MVGQREINANFSGNRTRVLIVSEIDHAFQTVPFLSVLTQTGHRSNPLSVFPAKHQKMNAIARLAFRSRHATRISLSGNLLVDSRSDRRNVLLGRLPLEAGVSICHINKVNPSPNRKPFPPARPQKIPLARLAGGRVATLIRGKTHSSCGFGA